MTRINAKPMPINDNDTYNSYKTCLTNFMESISRHVTPLAQVETRRAPDLKIALFQSISY